MGGQRTFLGLGWVGVELLLLLLLLGFGVWRAWLPPLPLAGLGLVGVVVCLCLSVGFKVFSAMFFYMYENMAELGVAGHVFGGIPSTQVQTIRRHNRRG